MCVWLQFACQMLWTGYQKLALTLAYTPCRAPVRIKKGQAVSNMVWSKAGQIFCNMRFLSVQRHDGTHLTTRVSQDWTMLFHCVPSLMYRMPARVAVAGVAYLRSLISKISFMWGSSRMRSFEGNVRRRLSSITLFMLSILQHKQCLMQIYQQKGI